MDEAGAATFVGKYVLVGLTYQSKAGEVLEAKQLHGRIVRINDQEGIVIALSPTGEEYVLPPALEALKEAPKGEYRLRSTGEIIVDPDLLTTWTITKDEREGT